MLESNISIVALPLMVTTFSDGRMTPYNKPWTRTAISTRTVLRLAFMPRPLMSMAHARSSNKLQRLSMDVSQSPTHHGTTLTDIGLAALPLGTPAMKA
jgi:hypothetical protein